LLVVIASYYVLFAAMSGSGRVVVAESALMHGRLVANPGVPEWWPAYCLAYDVTVAGFLAWLLAVLALRWPFSPLTAPP
jgi:hypothetical protein